MGRDTGIPRDERLCKLCGLNEEDEKHFLLNCPVYKSLREKYINILSSKVFTKSM